MLCIASANRYVEIVWLLLEERADAKAIDANRRTLLFLVYIRGYRDIVEYLSLYKAATNIID